MATLALQDPNGFTPVAAAGGGDEMPQGTEAGGWSLPVVLYVANGDVASHDVTINGVSHPVGAGDTALLPVSGIYHGQMVPITYSGVTSVTVAAVDLRG